MLVEFRVKNFRSFRDEQVLSMVASERDDDTLPENYVQVGKHKLLKAAAIYGANASGKSNVVKALGAFVALLSRRPQEDENGDPPIVPFLFDPENRGEPSTFESSFYCDSVLYRYGFSATNKLICHEWLFAYPKFPHEQKWFERHNDPDKGERWYFGARLRGKCQSLAGKTLASALFLPVAGEFNHPQLRQISEYLRRNLRPVRTDRPFWQITETLVRGVEGVIEPEAARMFVRDLLRKADMGVCDVKLSTINVDEIRFADDVPKEERETLLEELRKRPPYRPSLVHDSRESEPYTLPFEEESEGTQRFFQLIGPWWQLTSLGYIVFLDELERSLHPLLSRELVRYILSPSTNDANAQLIFTTHDVTLLDPMLFRRDQIWFTEKGNDGASRLYPLSDYKPRKDESFMRGYMSGRYGAIPMIEAFDQHDS